MSIAAAFPSSPSFKTTPMGRYRHKLWVSEKIEKLKELASRLGRHHGNTDDNPFSAKNILTRLRNERRLDPNATMELPVLAA